MKIWRRLPLPLKCLIALVVGVLLNSLLLNCKQELATETFRHSTTTTRPVSTTRPVTVATPTAVPYLHQARLERRHGTQVFAVVSSGQKIRDPRTGGLPIFVVEFHTPVQRAEVTGTPCANLATMVFPWGTTGNLATMPWDENPKPTDMHICVVAGEQWYTQVINQVGDVTGDGQVNIFDMTEIRNNLNEPVTADNFRNDVNCDGAINVFDLIEVRSRLNQ